jgi:flagellar basal-body rod protein FlgB
MSPNGNSVSLETEMVKAVEVKRQHDQALAIYKSSMNVLRASIGRG